MNFKRIFFTSIFVFMFLSSTVFAEYPGEKEEKAFAQYFLKICKSIKDWDKADEYADEFDHDNNIEGLPFARAMELRRNYLKTYKRGNGRFGSASLALKLDELGFENYQTIIVLSNGYVDFSNLYRTRTNDWCVADFFIGVERVKGIGLEHLRNPFKRIKRDKLNKYLCLQSSKIPLQTYVDDLSSKMKSFAVIHKSNDEKLTKNIEFLDIKDFLFTYELNDAEIKLTLPANLTEVYCKDRWRIFDEKSIQLCEMKCNNKT